MLNILGRTLANCQKNIFGVLILFLFVVLGYSITGNTLFGDGMWDFRDINTSFSSLLRMLMGDFDYPSMRAENRYLAGIYFWTFEVLGLFVLLNFITAFIADGFDKATENQSKDVLGKQIEALIARVKGIRINYDTLLRSHDSFLHMLYNSDAFRYKQLLHFLSYSHRQERDQMLSQSHSLVSTSALDFAEITLKRADLEYALQRASVKFSSQWLNQLWTEIVQEHLHDEDRLEDDELELFQHSEDGVSAALQDTLKGLDELISSSEFIQQRLTHAVNLTMVYAPTSGSTPPLIGSPKRQ